MRGRHLWRLCVHWTVLRGQLSEIDDLGADSAVSVKETAHIHVMGKSKFLMILEVIVE